MYRKEPMDNSYGRSSLAKSGFEVYLESTHSNYCREEHQVYCNENKLYATTWTNCKPNVPKVADLLFIHGYSEHSGRFLKHLSMYLDSGITVHLIDLPGHGRSDGKFGKLISHKLLLDCLLRYVLVLDCKYQFENFYLMGSSLGSLLVLNLGLQLEKLDGSNLIHLKGVLTLAPPIFPAGIHSLTKIEKWKLHIIHRFTPDLLLSHSQDSNLEQEFVLDPLNYKGGLKLSTFIFLIQAIRKLKKNLHHLKLPIIIVQGLMDTNIDPIGAKFIYDQCTSKDKTLKLFKLANHDLLNSNSNSTQISKLCLSWIINRSK